MRVHYHTDCGFFSGADNMIAVLLREGGISSAHEVSLSYRATPEFEAGLRSRIPHGVRLYPLPLLDAPAVTGRIRALPVRAVAKGIFHLFGVKYWFVLYNERLIRAVLSEVRPDVLHVNNGGYPGSYSCASAVLAAARVGTSRVVYVVNNMAVPYTTFRRWLDRPLDAAVKRGVTRFVTGSCAAAARLRDVLTLAPERVSVLPNGVLRREVRRSPEDVRADLGVAPHEPLLLVVANLEPRKGHTVLLDALVAMRAAGSALPRVVLEGAGAMRTELEDAVARRGLAETVSLIGRTDDVFSLMNACDVLVLPSLRDEDFPNVILEAMSLGRPVVATRVAGIPEQIVNGATGLVVEPGDAPALARALSALLADPEARAVMGAAGRARYEAEYTPEAATARYESLYAGLTDTMDGSSGAAGVMSEAECG